MASPRSSISSMKKPSRHSSSAASSTVSSGSSTKKRSRSISSSSSVASSSVSSTSCSLSSTGSLFQRDGGPEDRAKRVPMGNGERQTFTFSRLGALVDKKAKDKRGELQLGIRLPFQQKTKMVDLKHMKPDELQRVKSKEVVYYCPRKQLLYSKDTFKQKKVRANRSSAAPLKSRRVREHPLKHAYMYHSYSECRCSKGGREVILELELTATMDALLPYGTLDDQESLSPDLVRVVRIRDLATGQTKLRSSYAVNGSLEKLKRGQKLWYSPKMDQYFTEEYVKKYLRTEAEYRNFLANPPKEHSHH